MSFPPRRRGPHCALLPGLVLLLAVPAARAVGVPSPIPEATAAEPIPEAPVGDRRTEPRDERDNRTFRLRYDFKGLNAVQYRVHQRSRIVTQKEDVQDVVANSVEISKHFRVISVDADGTALLESMIDRARMAVRFDDADPTRYDTASGETPPKQFRDVQKQVGRPLARLKVAANGKLLSLTKLGKGGAATGESTLNANDNVLVEFPDRPLRIGDTWQQRFDVDVVVTRTAKHPVTLQRTFVLESVENGRASIGYKVAIITAISDPKISMQLVQLVPTGRIVFDVERGTILSRSQSIDERVFGPFGAGSIMHAMTDRNEELVDPAKETRTAAKP